MSRDTLDVLRSRHGLDLDLPQRYLGWLRSVARGEMGYSFAYGMPVGELLWPRIINTLLLASLAQLLAWGIALPWGVWTAWRPRGWLDRAGVAAAGVLLAVPEVLLALAALVFAARTRAFPTGGMRSLDFASMPFFERLSDVAWHLALPVLVLALVSLPVLLRHVRAALAEVLEEPFIRAARAYGAPPARLLLRHALPAAAHPLISLFSFSVATLLSGSLLVEVVLSWPGLGPFLLDAILARDLYVVVGAILASAVFVLAGQLLADLMLAGLDPRLREPT